MVVILAYLWVWVHISSFDKYVRNQQTHIWAQFPWAGRGIKNCQILLFWKWWSISVWGATGGKYQVPVKLGDADPSIIAPYPKYATFWSLISATIADSVQCWRWTVDHNTHTWSGWPYTVLLYSDILCTESSLRSATIAYNVHLWWLVESVTPVTTLSRAEVGGAGQERAIWSKRSLGRWQQHIC